MNWLQYNYDLSLVLSLATKAKRSERGSQKELESLKRKRFARLLTYSRTYSPYYKNLYRGERSDLSLDHLATLPTVTKINMMENFDEVLTDRSISKSAVLEFAENPANLGDTLRGKYFVARTSGTTGLVGHYLHDLFSYFLINVLTAVRSPGVKPLPFLRSRHFLPGRLRIASVLSPSANLGVASVIASAPKWVRMLVDFKLLDNFEPWEKTLTSLNNFRPDILGSFPTVLEPLAESQLEGRLRIHPHTIRSGGEMLTARVRKRISEAFGCEVYDSYGCAESGWVGIECEERRGIHLFSDWIVVEPVDKDDRRVPLGVESDKILITNLANYVQPFIRFELPDRVTVLDGDCPCGSILPRVLLKGRASEVLYLLDGNGNKVAVPPVHLTTLAEMVPGIQRYQIIQEDEHRLSVLFTARSDVTSEEVGASLRTSFDDYLSKNGLKPHVSLLVTKTDVIQRDPSGKIRQVFSRVIT
jgi:phenylacetate-CoA ligase